MRTWGPREGGRIDLRIQDAICTSRTSGVQVDLDAAVTWASGARRPVGTVPLDIDSTPRKRR